MCPAPGFAFAVALLHLLGFVCLAAPARAEGTEDRIARLEASLRRQSEEMERLRGEFEAYRTRNPAPTALTEDEAAGAVEAYLARDPAGVATVGGGAPGGLRWGGYMTTYFAAPSFGNSYFDLNRLVLTASGSVGDRIDFHAEIEIESGGVTDELDGEIVLEQAEAVLRCRDEFNPKAGAILIPFGRYNLEHEDPRNDFTFRPFTATYLLPTGFAQPGVGAEGSVLLPRGHVLSYDVALTSGYRDAFDAEEGVREARQFWSGDTNEGKQAWGRGVVAWNSRLLDRLETGVSATWARYDARDRNDLLGYAVDFLARRGPFELKGEYVAYEYRRNHRDPADAIRGQSGLWLEGAYHFFPCAWRRRPCGPLTDTSLFTLALRYQWMDLDDRARGATFEDDLEAWSVALNLRVTERTVLRIDHTWYVPLHGERETEWTASFSTFF